MSVLYYDDQSCSGYFYIAGHTRGQTGGQNQPHCNPALITLWSPIDNSSKQTLQSFIYSGLESRHQGWNISMIYTWPAGARLDWNFTLKTSHLSLVVATDI